MLASMADSSFTPGTFSTNAGTREYELYTPSNLSAGSPLFLMLHGCTQDPDDFAAGTRMNVLAEENGFAVVYPAQPSSVNARSCWNWFCPSHQGQEGESGLLAALTREMAARLESDPKRIFVAGMSAGAAMAAVLALNFPNIFSAMGAHSGIAPHSASNVLGALLVMKGLGRVKKGPLIEIPSIIFQGDADGTVNVRNGERMLHAIKEGTDEETTCEWGTQTLRKDSEGRVFGEYWKVHGLGHAWSGGSPLGSYTKADGPEASREMVRFFLNS